MSKNKNKDTNTNPKIVSLNDIELKTADQIKEPKHPQQGLLLQPGGPSYAAITSYIILQVLKKNKLNHCHVRLFDDGSATLVIPSIQQTEHTISDATLVAIIKLLDAKQDFTLDIPTKEFHLLITSEFRQFCRWEEATTFNLQAEEEKVIGRQIIDEAEAASKDMDSDSVITLFPPEQSH